MSRSEKGIPNLPVPEEFVPVTPFIDLSADPAVSLINPPPVKRKLPESFFNGTVPPCQKSSQDLMNLAHELTLHDMLEVHKIQTLSLIAEVSLLRRVIKEVKDALSETEGHYCCTDFEEFANDLETILEQAE